MRIAAQREKTVIFVVADSIGRNASVFALAVIASVHFDNKPSF